MNSVAGKSNWPRHVKLALLLPLLLPTAALTAAAAAAIIQTMYDAHCYTQCVCVFHFHLNLFHILAIVQLDTKYASRFHLDSDVHYC